MFDTAVDASDEDAWAEVSGGPALAALLAGQVEALGRLDSYGLVELVAAAQRLTGWAAAVQARAVRTLDERLEGEQQLLNGGWVRPDALSVTDVEVAARLGTSRASAGYLVTLASGLGRLPATEEALGLGQITVAKAQVLSRALGVLPRQVAAAIEARVLPRAARMGTAALRREVAREIHAVDPAAAAERAEVAREERHVRLYPSGVDDAMAWIVAYLPAETAAAIDAVLTGIARTARTQPGEDRGTCALRADAFAAAILDADAPAADAPAGAAGAAGATAVAGAAGVRAGKAGARVRRVGPGDTVGMVHLTVSAATLLGADEDPGWIPGVGPVTAAVARALAADMRWVRILTDPRTGALLEHGATVYTPSAGVARHVRTRDARCVAPWCDRPAQDCDLDHTTPFPAGPTTPDNLGALCRRDHRIKHETAWQLTQPRPGHFTWVSPTGHTYTRTPQPLAAATRDITGSVAGYINAGVTTQPDDPPWDPSVREPPWEPEEETRDLCELAAA